MKRIPLFLLAAVVGCERPQPVEPLEVMELPGAIAFAHTAQGNGVLTEPAFYNGQLVHFLLPAAGSKSDNVQVVADCFRVGPRVPDNVPIRGTVWVLIIDGSSHETTCSTDGRDAGELTHNHVFSAAPGDPDYNGKFEIVVVDEGPNFPGAQFADTYNSAAAVAAGIAADELTVVAPNVARVNWSVKK